ncbi:MAG: acyl-CoA dehydrogenase N-terminal domain-containing protein, partial [Kangiellaceae bacterium]|nr:acyl-CoA dehydrogenase N-terminal domain-containing protein [Kangiellaceae bacterium]
MDDQLITSQELNFQLYELLDTEQLLTRSRFSEHSRDVFDATLNTAEKIAREKFAPHNAKGDTNEPTFDG